MNRPAYPEQFLRQRKFYLILPVLALPFLTLLFWKIVIKPLEKRGRLDAEPAGLQLSLPFADLKTEQNMDKLAYYRKADQDSANWAQQIKKDPYRQHESLLEGQDSTSQALLGLAGPARKQKQSSKQLAPHSASEIRLHQKLLALDKALGSAGAPSLPEKAEMPTLAAATAPELAHLEKMMQQITDQPPSPDDDPEMTKLDSMLDKLLKLQENPEGHPKSASLDPAPHAGLPVRQAAAEQQISLLGADSLQHAAPTDVNTGFYGLADNMPEEQKLTAVIDQTQQLVSGNVIALRLTSPLYVGGLCIPENSLIYGTASVSGERLKIKITSLKAPEGILAVNLSVYDLDGLEGIYIPGALSRQIAKQQLATQVQGYRLDTDPFSAGAQAASAGIQMGKMLLSRKTRLVQVTVTEGYKVILFDQSANHP